MQPDLLSRDTFRVADGARREQEGVRQAKRQVVQCRLGYLEVCELLQLEHVDVVAAAGDKLTRFRIAEVVTVGDSIRVLQEDNLGGSCGERHDGLRETFE